MADAAQRFVSEVQLWTLAESLGSVKSLLCHPATMTHASVEPEVRRERGVLDSLVRLSVGIEDHRDLWKDLDQALAKVKARHGARSRRPAGEADTRTVACHAAHVFVPERKRVTSATVASYVMFSEAFRTCSRSFCWESHRAQSLSRPSRRFSCSSLFGQRNDREELGHDAGGQCFSSL